MKLRSRAIITNYDEKVYPQYDKLSLVNIPATILKHFSIPISKPTLPEDVLKVMAGCSKVILFLIDGLGFNLWEEEITKQPIFNEMTKKGITLSLTSVFPPSTAGAVTTLNTGLTPREHGLLEWFLYLSEVDSIVETIPFKIVRTQLNNNEQTSLNDPKIIFNGQTIYQILKKRAIKSFAFLPEQYISGAYTKSVIKGAELIPYITIADLFISLLEKLSSIDTPSYFYVYWPEIDTVEHTFGPWSPQVTANLELLSFFLKKQFIDKLDKNNAKDTVIIFTADHGQLSVDPKKTTYLNNFPRILSCLKKSKNGKPILPSGNPRNVFLSVEIDKQQFVIDSLKKALRDRTEVILLDQPTTDRLFGASKKPHPDFNARLGNILILPNGNNTVWYKFLPEEKFKLLGHHGGLSRESMLVPLLVVRASDLLND